MDQQHGGLLCHLTVPIAFNGFFELLNTDLFIFEERIGRFGVVPAILLLGNAGSRLSTDVVDNSNKPLLATYIPKIQLGEIIDSHLLHLSVPSFTLKV